MQLSSTAGATRLRTDDFDYPLPSERIAQVPLDQRDASRLLHVEPNSPMTDHAFTDIPDLLHPGDLLVANDTTVRSARLHGRREGGGVAEVLVVEKLSESRFICLVKPGRSLHAGAQITFDDTFTAFVEGHVDGHPGMRTVEFQSQRGAIVDEIERCGVSPLPPYIHTALNDSSRYQTTYATGAPESAAAPTAGLHFTDAVRAALCEKGVGWVTVRLGVGIGTFTPIRSTYIDEHVMHKESYEISNTAVEAINETKRQGGRVVAVGTTAVRVLEACARRDDSLAAHRGATELFLTPGDNFQIVDGLITNFHQPRSSLAVLVAAFVGYETWKDAYAYALDHDYRFLSFGDCMLAWRQQA